MFDGLSMVRRIDLAKSKMDKVLDHFLYLIELHVNNEIVVYSPTLSSQIPESFAAHAFNVFQRGMHQFEIVRLCALWDGAGLEKENVPTVIELIDDDEVLDALAAETRNHWHKRGGAFLNPSDDPELRAIEEEVMKESNFRFGNEQAEKARADLQNAIKGAREVLASTRIASVMNLRNKHLAHSLSNTRREKTHGVIAPMKYGDETELIEASIPIIEKLYCWVTGKGFSIVEAREIDRKNAEALWNGCKFEVLG